jgi:hypothetical protein
MHRPPYCGAATSCQASGARSNRLEECVMAIRASCLCGGMKLLLDSVVRMGNCHCSICRKAHGGAFATFAIVPMEHYRLLSRQELIADYQSSAQHVRHFCRRCGATLPYQTMADYMDVPASLLDDDSGVRPRAHIFATSRAPWFEITDDLPQYDGWSRDPDGNPLKPIS